MPIKIKPIRKRLGSGSNRSAKKASTRKFKECMHYGCGMNQGGSCAYDWNPATCGRPGDQDVGYKD